MRVGVGVSVGVRVGVGVSVGVRVTVGVWVGVSVGVGVVVAVDVGSGVSVGVKVGGGEAVDELDASLSGDGVTGVGSGEGRAHPAASTIRVRISRAAAGFSRWQRVLIRSESARLCSA